MAECPRCRKADCPTLGGNRWFPKSSMEAWRSCAIDTAKRLEDAEAELASDEHFNALATEHKVEWNARVAAEAEVKRLHALVEDAWVEAAITMKREGSAIFAQSESCKARGPNG